MSRPSRRPRLSFGVAVYNSDETRLRRSIDSLLAQTDDDFEVIICDNSPDDATGVICRTYVDADPRVRYSHNRLNVGAYPSFFRTLEIADGEYFKWVADDDTLEPTYVERCLEVLEADDSIALCFSRVNLRSTEGEPIDEGDLGNITALQDDPADRFLAVLNHHWKAHGYYGIFRTKHLRRMHPVSEECVRLRDILVLAEIALYGRIEQVPEVLMTYRQQQKDWSDREALNTSQYASCYPRNPNRGVTLPNVKFAWELLEAVRYSDLPREAKSRLYMTVPELIESRIADLWHAEIQRAVGLVLGHRLFHEWGEPVVPVDAARLRRDLPGMFRFHAAEMLRRFEEVTAVWPGYPEPGLRSARAVLLALLNRLPEAHAALQIELNCFPDFAPARSMLERLEAATAAPA